MSGGHTPAGLQRVDLDGFCQHPQHEIQYLIGIGLPRKTMRHRYITLAVIRRADFQTLPP